MRALRVTVLLACSLGDVALIQAQPGAAPPPIDPPPAPDPETDALRTTPTGSAAGSRNAEIYAALPPLDLPPIDPDTLAFGKTFEIASANLTSNSVGRASDSVDNETTTIGFTAATRYFQSLETKTLAWSVLASGDDTLNRVPAPGGSLITNSLALAGSPEARFYPSGGSLLFLYGAADLSTAIQSTKQTGMVDASNSNAPGTLGFAAGVGFGRVLSIDPVVRLRRLEQALAARGILAGEIPQATGTEIVRTWYALRNDIGTYRTLAYTMKNLSAAGLLTADPDLLSTYEALQILNDPFIVRRLNGWEARAGVGVVKPFVGWDDMAEADALYAVLGSAQYEQPLDTTRQVSLRAKLLFELGSIDDAPRQYNLRLFAAYTKVYYHDTYDPLGSLSLAAQAGASGVRVPGADPEVGLDVVGSAAYSRVLNRGSLATGALNLSYRNDGVFALILSLGITWGVATGYFTPYTPAAVGI